MNYSFVACNEQFDSIAYYFYYQIVEVIKKHYKLVVSLIFLVIYLGIFVLVRIVLNEDTAEFKAPRDAKESVEIKPAKVTLVVQGGNYQVRLENKDTLGDLLEEARNDGFLIYELEYTTSGSKIVSVNGVSRIGSEWVFYDGDTKVGKEFKDYKLDDNNIYYLVLE